MARKEAPETDLYCQERQRQKPEDMLRQLWRAVEQSADLVVITDRSGSVEYVNPAFEILTGYPQAEGSGKTLRILKSEEQEPAICKEMWQTILAGKVFRGIVVNRKKNGETFIVEKSITPLRDGVGQITHFISTDRDITEKAPARNPTATGGENGCHRQPGGGVAHDFNNLLKVAQGD
jgi:PAS domain S-box-containing protein